jgi:hypothetical protein
MHPTLRAYFDLVWPLFWPWLIWNLLRLARWHERTGRDGLFAVDCFGNLRLIALADAPPPDSLYTYEAPRVPRWERPAVCSAAVAAACAYLVKSAMVRHDPDKSGIVIYSHGIVQHDHGLHVRGPP